MTEVASPTNGQPTNGQSQVPLDTIPVSPDGSTAAAGDRPDTDSGPITVFHDPENFNVKHPLMSAWTLWFTKPPSGRVG